MHKQVSGWTVNFCPNSPESPFLEFQTRKPPHPPPPKWKTSDLGWPKFTPPPPTPRNEKLQIWDDQSLLRNTPTPKMKNFRFGMTKVYSGGIPPPPTGLEYGRSYVETNLYPPWIPLVLLVLTRFGAKIKGRIEHRPMWYSTSVVVDNL